MPPLAPTADAPPRGPGAPRKMTDRFRWSLWVDRPVHERAKARAEAEGRDLSEVMRNLERKYAEGKIKA